MVYQTAVLIRDIFYAHNPMKEAFYFSHDYNTRTDPKIKKLLAKHGMLGFGIWWAVLEDLYNNANALQLDTESIAYDLRVDCEVVKSVIFDFNLFQVEDDIISSKSVQERMDKRLAKSVKASESAKARWDKKEKNANAMRTHSEGNAIKESKVKESIEKDNKEKEGKRVSEETQGDVFSNFEIVSVDQKKTEPEKKTKSKPFDPSTLSLPFGSEFFKVAWGNWCLHRKQIKKPLTQLAAEGQLKKLSGFDELLAIKFIENTIAGGWIGIVYELKNNTGSSPTGKGNIQKNHESINRAVDFLIQKQKEQNV